MTMKAKHITGLVLVLVWFTLLLSGCALSGSAGTRSPYEQVIRRYVRRDLGLDINIGGSEIADCYDSHGGFHGDGETFLEVHFTDQAFAQALAARDGWHGLPLDPDVDQFIYHFYGTYWSPSWDSEQEQWAPGKIPAIEHGYWRLVDRQPESSRAERVREDEPFGINNRYSYNLTIGLYDTDHDILYVLALDT